MAFFGFGGYSEKTYAKNTEDYKNRLYNMMSEAMGYEGVGKVLNAAMMALSKNAGFPAGADKKAVEAIDARIDKLLGLLNEDLQQKSQAKLAAHAGMILSAISDARNFGKDLRDAQQIDAEEKMVETYARIEDILRRKEAIQQKMDDIYRRCQKVDENSAEFQMLEIQYTKCEQDIEELDVNLQLYKAQYDNCASILNAMAESKIYDDFNDLDIMKPADFAKLTDSNARRQADRVSKIEDIKRIGEERRAERRAGAGSVGTTRSSLADRKAADEQAKMAANINGAQAPSQSAAPTSSLRSRLGK